jgi:hypothetical protein
MAARLRGVPVVPIGLRYEFGEDPKPDLLASVGAPLKPIPSDRQMVGDLERAVAAELDVIDRELASPSGTFSPLLATRQRGLPVGSLLLSRLAGARKA